MNLPENYIPVLDKGYVGLKDQLGDDTTIVNAAKVSYNKEALEFGPGEEGLLRFLLNHGHTSPFRHAVMQFEVYAPLLVARQWWKYSVASAHWDDQHAWNESSRRYVTEEPAFHIPSTWREAPQNSKQGSGGPAPQRAQTFFTGALREHVEHSRRLYEQALKDGIAPEQARLFLPAYGMYVRWRWTISLSGVLHFLDERLEHDAQWEIQQYAQAVDTLVERGFPHTHAARSNRRYHG